ncbi:MAG: DUF1579 family protein [Planctomycetota bacterium]
MVIRFVCVALIAAGLLQMPANAQEMPTPSKQHKILMQDVGEWEIAGKMMMPDGMVEFKGEEKVVAIGGFWTVSDYSADVLGGLKGSLTLGYDAGKKAYVGTWVDSFQPTPTKMKGTFDQKSSTMTFETVGMGMDGKPMPGRIVVQYKDKNTHTFKMLSPDPTGATDKMVTTMEMVYTRK